MAGETGEVEGDVAAGLAGCVHLQSGSWTLSGGEWNSEKRYRDGNVALSSHLSHNLKKKR